MILTFDFMPRPISDNRVKTITIYLDENKMIEGIKIASWYEVDQPGWATNLPGIEFFQKIRTFGNTAKAENICAECTIELAKDDSITSISYRKSTAWVRNSKLL